jgi:hypothetical protein
MNLLGNREAIPVEYARIKGKSLVKKITSMSLVTKLRWCIAHRTVRKEDRGPDCRG